MIEVLEVWYKSRLTYRQLTVTSVNLTGVRVSVVVVPWIVIY